MAASPDPRMTIAHITASHVSWVAKRRKSMKRVSCTTLDLVAFYFLSLFFGLGYLASMSYTKRSVVRKSTERENHEGDRGRGG